MDELFDGCEHLIESLYDYAEELKVPLELVDIVMFQRYVEHKKHYERFAEQGAYDEARVRNLNVHVLDYHVMSDIDKLAGKKKLT